MFGLGGAPVVNSGRRSPPAFAVASAAVSTGLRSTAPLRIRSRRHRQEHLRSCRRPEQTNSYARSRRTAPSHGHYGRHHRHRSFALLAAPSKRPATGHGREGHTATASMPARPSARRIAATHPRSYVSPHMPHSHDPSHMPHRPVKSCQRGHGIMAPSPSHNATTSPDNTPSRMPRHPI